MSASGKGRGNHPQVRFGEEVNSVGKDNDIGFEYACSENKAKVTVHLGFLQIRHIYRINFDLSRKVCHLEKATNLIPKKADIPKLNIKLLKINPLPNSFEVEIELTAHKEKLLKESIHLVRTDTEKLLELCFIARVLGKGKGTPLLKNGIKSISIEPDEESDASDWPGFSQNNR